VPRVSLRLRLFLLVAGLVALLVAAQTLLVRSLAARLDRDVRVVATRVGEQILSGFEFHTEETGGTVPRSSAPGETSTTVLFVGPAAATPGAATPEPGAPAPEAADKPSSGTPRWVVRREWTRPGAEPGSVEHRLDVRVLAGSPGAGGTPRLVLEPGADADQLLLRGPALARAIRIPRTPVASTLDRFGSTLAAGSLAILALGLIAAAVLAHRATRPLVRLEDAARRLGAGERGVAVEVDRRDEIGAALAAFNAMSLRLDELDAENRRLTEAQQLSELGEVARGLAHTLRNPLHALGLAVEELAEAPPAGRASALAESARAQIRRVDGALRSFLALASADAAAPAATDLAALAREVALEVLQDAAGRVRVEVESGTRAPVTLTAVPAEVRAILQALIVNAVEASPEDGRVRVRVAPAPEDRVRIEIEDEGAGVAPELAARLFAPHVTTKPHGSGMGLFLAQRLAAGRYAGSIALEARASAGTRATVVLAARRGSPG
jgi:signal transduction histidine kinase